MDRILAGSAIVVLAPVLVTVALALILTQGRPVLFRQQRIGLGGQAFTILKFRTMRLATDEFASLLDGGARVTRLGRLLRRTSVDELPTLVNVIRGEMSLIGPRPLLIHHLPLYRDSHPERLLARPGLTGAAQVSGRRALTFKERLDLDVEYVRTASPAGDLRILLRTVFTVLADIGRRSEGIIAEVDDIGLADEIRSASRAERWEHGSFLQPHGPIGSEGDDSFVIERSGVLFGTARQAFIALARNAARVHVPTYFCPDVVDALRSSGVAQVVAYSDHPLAGPSKILAGVDDLVVVHPHFGRPTQVSVENGRLLIDVTQAFGREGRGLTTDASGRPADVCVASLRKTLPLPDGALVWTPAGTDRLESPPLGEAHAAAARRVDAALRAKVALLAGERSDKVEVLREIVSAIEMLEAGRELSTAIPETGVRLRGFDVAARWAAREQNRHAAVARLESLGILTDGRIEILDSPFMLILLVGTHADRERLRAGLIARDVYPAVLWPHEHLSKDSAERRFSDRMLALHVDARYSPRDLELVVDHVHALLASEERRK